MNDEELLESIASLLPTINPDKWAKEYHLEKGRSERSIYHTTIGGDLIFGDIILGGISISLCRTIYFSPIQNLFIGKENYSLDVYPIGNILISKYYTGSRNKRYIPKLRELYYAIEEKVGKITDKDDRTSDENLKLITDIKESSRMLKVIK